MVIKDYNKTMLNIRDIYDAAERLSDTVHHTPIEFSTTFSDMSKAQVFLKCENQQKTGSFKVRGAMNMIRKLNLEKGSVVISCSAGNHAQGVAFSAEQAGVKAIIYMPTTTPLAKITATRGYGAEVRLYGDGFDESLAEALRVCKELNATFIPPFDNEDIIAGQGTIGLEILEDCKNLDAIIVQAGGGGLLSGIAFAVKSINPNIKVYGVQAEHSSPIARSFRRKVMAIPSRVYTIADGIAVRCPGTITMKYINQFVDDVMTVTDDEIASTIIMLIERSKQIVEPAGAAGLAALLRSDDRFKGKKVACILSGGNIDVSFINKIIERGLISRGRQIRISVVLPDRPGSLEDFAHVMRENNANIISVQYDRVSAELSLNETILHISFEASGFEHGNKVIDALKKADYKLVNN